MNPCRTPLSEKALWPFLGKPLLAHQMERLQKGGLKNITFVGGQHNIEQVHQFFSDVPSIEQENLVALTPWLDWAYATVKAQSQAVA